MLDYCDLAFACDVRERAYRLLAMIYRARDQIQTERECGVGLLGKWKLQEQLCEDASYHIHRGMSILDTYIEDDDSDSMGAATARGIVHHAERLLSQHAMLKLTQNEPTTL